MHYKRIGECFNKGKPTAKTILVSGISDVIGSIDALSPSDFAAHGRRSRDLVVLDLSAVARNRLSKNLTGEGRL